MLAIAESRSQFLRRKYFGDYYPAVTAVEVKRLYRPDFMIEIEAIAALP